LKGRFFMAEQEIKNTLQTPDFLVQERLETSVSELLFTQKFVYKVWQLDHPLIKGLNDSKIRKEYLLEELKKGQAMGAGDIYEGLILVLLPNEEGQNKVITELPIDFSEPFIKGERVAWALKMKRFKPEQRMDFMLQNGLLEDIHVQDAAKKIIGCHQTLPHLNDDFGKLMTKDISEEAASIADSAFSFEFMINLLNKEIDPFKVTEIAKNNRFFLAEKKEEFSKAVLNGEIKKGHGDPKILNINVGDGQVGEEGKSYILDAISFKLKDEVAYTLSCGTALEDEWTINDLLSDLAYFSLYFDYLKPQKFSTWFQIIDDVYQQMTGNNSLQNNPRFWFYLNYRAMVQAKVAGIEAAKAREKGEINKALEKRAEAAEFISLAEKYLRQTFDLTGLNWQEMETET